jgi:lysophospholipase L1-like esterase
VLLLLYGTNDESEALPQSIFAQQEITTSESLRYIILTARANKTLVVVATLPPVCGHARIGQRSRTVTMNDKIRALALELGQSDLGIILADPWADFLTASPPDGCGLIGEGGNHPTDGGYVVLATSFSKALQKVLW